MKKFNGTIVDTQIEDYIDNLSKIEDQTIVEMEEFAYSNDIPIVGPIVGRFLQQITTISKANTVFELGSGFGYSAYWIARGLGDGGVVICTDYSEENSRIAKNFFEMGNLSTKMKFLNGNSINLLKDSKGYFDIIFNDVDKEYYPEVIDLAYKKLSVGGILITDNVLWYGRVIEEDDLPSTAGVREYNSRIFSMKNFFTSIIPMRDGLSISIKIS